MHGQSRWIEVYTGNSQERCIAHRPESSTPNFRSLETRWKNWDRHTWVTGGQPVTIARRPVTLFYLVYTLHRHHGDASARTARTISIYDSFCLAEQFHLNTCLTHILQRLFHSRIQTLLTVLYSTISFISILSQHGYIPRLKRCTTIFKRHAM